MTTTTRPVPAIKPWGAETRYVRGRGWEMRLHAPQAGRERATLFGVDGLAHQGDGPTGWVPAVKAAELRVGDRRVYHFGATETITRLEHGYGRVAVWTDRLEDGQPTHYMLRAGELIAVDRAARNA